nr:hypothetical protein [Candidatus Sigynarchaeum springense]
PIPSGSSAPGYRRDAIDAARDVARIQGKTSDSMEPARVRFARSTRDGIEREPASDDGITGVY